MVVAAGAPAVFMVEGAIAFQAAMWYVKDRKEPFATQALIFRSPRQTLGSNDKQEILCQGRIVRQSNSSDPCID